jgi:hypothetical protein
VFGDKKTTAQRSQSAWLARNGVSLPVNQYPIEFDGILQEDLRSGFWFPF